jgi:adenylosuccinate lyase
MLKNFNSGADKAIAEPLQLLLSAYGYQNSHEYVGNLADESSATGVPLKDIVLKDANLKPYLEKFTARQIEIINDPSKYVGIAAKKAKNIADLWSKRMDELRSSRT